MSSTKSPPARRPRLRRVDCSGPGLTRIRRGRGFSYADADGHPVRDPDELLRLKELVIPPAWREVWICAHPNGHLQATGVDAAGRKQYLYHPRWNEQQSTKKFDHMLRFADELPALRRRILKTLRDGEEPDRERVLACAIRLLDVGLFRIGSEQYAEDDDREGGIGLATLSKSEVTLRDDDVVFEYVGKSGKAQSQAVRDPAAIDVVRTLRRRRGGGDRLLAFRENRRWHDLRSAQVSDHLKDLIGDEYSAKDFRTWNATVLAAVSIAADGRQATTPTARTRAINGAVKSVARVLGNTPAVARRSYIDPRVFDRYRSKLTIGPEIDAAPLDGPDDRRRARLEAAVLDLLRDPRASDAVARDAA